MKKVLFILFVIAILGCAKTGSYVETSNSNDDFVVKKLFEVDDIIVYRFIDAGHYVYFTNKSGKICYEYQTRNGKATTVHVQQTICND